MGPRWENVQRDDVTSRRGARPSLPRARHGGATPIRGEVVSGVVARRARRRGPTPAGHVDRCGGGGVWRGGG